MNASDYVARYNERPEAAAKKLAQIWCDNQTEIIDIWDCDFPCKKFFIIFLDLCKERGFLKEALHIRWMVHNAPSDGKTPCFSNHVNQWIIDYAKKHHLESEIEPIKDKGLNQEAFKWYFDIIENKEKEQQNNLSKPSYKAYIEAVSGELL